MTIARDFRSALMRWYRRQGRHEMPWRLTRDPYAILVSEVMLQQTQVDRVLPYYERWLARWPTVETLAAASPADAIREWAGLGYNRRALYLHRTSLAITNEYGGRFPSDVATLRALPGVGAYTAAAIAAFAHRARVAVVDTNIARVLARAALGVGSQRELAGARLTQAGVGLLPSRNVRDHNLALMDLGAMVCTARSPDCAACPIRRHCAWHSGGMPPATASPGPNPPFESTARYARGRIIDALRQHSCLDASDIGNVLPLSHRTRLDTYLDGLERDGLVRRTDAGWSLPV